MKIGPFYGELRKGGLEYGARFANVRELWLGKAGSGEAIGRITNAPVVAEKEKDPFMNAILLDGCLHVFGAALGRLDDVSYQGAFVPHPSRRLPCGVSCRLRIGAMSSRSSR
jgi:hypothetical protein